MAHYDKVFVVDYRHFYNLPQYNNSVLQLLEENNVKDVILLNNIFAASNLDRINEIRELFY